MSTASKPWLAAGTLLLSLTGLPTPSNADQEALLVPQVGHMAFGGDMSPADIIGDRSLVLLEADPQAEVSFKVTIQVVRDGKILVQDANGLPGGRPPPEEPYTQYQRAEMTLPFKASDYRTDGFVDVDALHASVSSQLSRLLVQEEPKNKIARENYAWNAVANCAGFGMGTVITNQFNSCQFGIIDKTYLCQANDKGGFDWYLIHQASWPTDSSCSKP